MLNLYVDGCTVQKICQQRLPKIRENILQGIWLTLLPALEVTRPSVDLRFEHFWTVELIFVTNL